MNAVDTTGNGLFVASASADFTIRLWKAMDSFACVGTYYTSAMDGALLSVSMGLRSFVCSSQKGVIRQFPLLGELPVCGPLTGTVCCSVTVLQGCVACVADPTVRVVGQVALTPCSNCIHTVFKLHSHNVFLSCQVAVTPCSNCIHTVFKLHSHRVRIVDLPRCPVANRTISPTRRLLTCRVTRRQRRLLWTARLHGPKCPSGALALVLAAGRDLAAREGFAVGPFC